MAERRPAGFGRVAAPAGPAPGAPAVLDDAAAAALLPERSVRGHKGTFGKLLVIAGSLDYAGAAVLVCRAAGRAGAGLVTLAVPESLQPLFASRVVEATTMALPEDDVEEVDPEAALAQILDADYDALVVGPGLRPGLATTELIRALLETPPDAGGPPVLIDAEALRSLATVNRWWEGVRRPAALTPHAGEFARLRSASGRDPEADGDLMHDDAARAAAAKDAAAQLGPGRGPQGCPDRHRRAGRRRRRRALREPGAGERRHGRCAVGDDRLAHGPGTRAIRGGATRRLPARARRRGGPGPGGGFRAPGVRPARRGGLRAASSCRLAPELAAGPSGSADGTIPGPQAVEPSPGGRRPVDREGHGRGRAAHRRGSRGSRSAAPGASCLAGRRPRPAGREPGRHSGCAAAGRSCRARRQGRRLRSRCPARGARARGGRSRWPVRRHV